MEKKLNMKLTLEVEGEEGFNINAEWVGTNLKTVKMVENELLKALANLNR